MIFGDHLGRRWLVYRLDLGAEKPSLRARFVACGVERLTDTVLLSRLDADKLSTMTRASGLWSGELVPGATGDGLAWSHVSIEGVQDGRSLYFEGTAALELKAFEPIRKEWLRILNPGVAGRVEELWRTGCDSSGKAVGDP
jgi:hypothetical protein